VAFRIDPKTGKLTKLNSRSSGGGAPCHLVVDKAGKHVLTANYTGGSVCVHAIQDDGSLGKQTSFVQHKGSSKDPNRQEAPHAHSVRLDAANRFAFVADLGLDKILIYHFDDGKLSPNEQAFESLPPGSGPRHFTFHPNGQLAFVICELGNIVTSFRYDPSKGTLKTLGRISTLPEGYKKPSYTAEVVVHPNGQFVYGSNRGHNSIAVLKVGLKSGDMHPVQIQGQGIKTPRNFNIDPTGKFLVVANQDGDNLLVFRIDASSGRLEPTGHQVAVPRPVCVQFLYPPK
jgi:6-phosphogluconolactonase